MIACFRPAQPFGLTGRTTGKDWQESYDFSICLLHSGRSWCRLTVGNAAMKSTKGVPAPSHLPSYTTHRMESDFLALQSTHKIWMLAAVNEDPPFENGMT